jgi:hypothetical protein
LVSDLPYKGYDSLYKILNTIKMKKLFKIAGYTMATVLAVILSQSSALAAGGSTGNDSALSGAQVIGGFAILVLVILLPILKSSRKATLK